MCSFTHSAAAWHLDAAAQHGAGSCYACKSFDSFDAPDEEVVVNDVCIDGGGVLHVLGEQRRQRGCRGWGGGRARGVGGRQGGVDSRWDSLSVRGLGRRKARRSPRDSNCCPADGGSSSGTHGSSARKRSQPCGQAGKQNQVKQAESSPLSVICGAGRSLPNVGWLLAPMPRLSMVGSWGRTEGGQQGGGHTSVHRSGQGAECTQGRVVWVQLPAKTNSKPPALQHGSVQHGAPVVQGSGQCGMAARSAGQQAMRQARTSW